MSLAGMRRGGAGLQRAVGAVRLGPSGADLVLASAVLLVAVPSVVTDRPPEGPLPLTLPVALAFVVAVGLRSRASLASVGLVTVAGVVQAVAGTSPGSLWAFAALLLVGVATGQRLDEAPSTAGLVVLVLGLWLQEWLDRGEDYLFILLVFGGAWLMGRGLRAWKTRARAAEEHQRDLARLAVAEERLRIARDLHDVVAHGLSVIAVQADAAEAALASDPARARDPLVAIRSSAREALGEMRQMLALLRTDTDESEANRDPDEAATRVPARGVGDLTRLVDSMSRAGLDVTATIELGAGPDLPPGLQLAIYRIAQEGLTNVAKHARSARTRLRVLDDDRVVVVEVENDPPSPSTHQEADAGRAESPTGRAESPTGRAESPTPRAESPSGQGLVGIRERVVALGGTTGAGHTAGGGYLLWAHLPSQGRT